MFQAVRRYYWIIPIAGTWAIALLWRRRGKQHLARDPALREGYTSLTRRLAFWGSIPWLVMGLGVLVGGVASVDEYSRPREADPWVVAWIGSVCFLWTWALWWILFRGGAEALVKHVGLVNPPLSRADYVRLVSVVLWVCGMVSLLMLTLVGPVAHPGDNRGGSYTTVHLVYDGYWKVVGVALFFLALGAGLLLGSIVWVRSLKLPRWWNHKEGIGPGFLLALSIFWLIAWSAMFPRGIWYSSRLVSIYRNGDAQVLEGAVHVLRRQPRSGHAKGDLIQVNGVELVINHFVYTPAYRCTIAHNGVLTEGRYVRLWHYKQMILRVDIR